VDSERHLEPGSDEALDDLKQDVAEDLGVPLEEDGDNGDLTARQLGKVGGNMVKRLVRLGEEALRREDQGGH
jgi:hypothetical protein